MAAIRCEKLWPARGKARGWVSEQAGDQWPERQERVRPGETGPWLVWLANPLSRERIHPFGRLAQVAGEESEISSAREISLRTSAMSS